MIIQNIPFISDKEEKYASCQGPPTVMMVLKYFGIDISFSELYKRRSYEKGKWFFEAYIVELLDSFRIPCKYYSDVHIRKIGDDAQEFKRISNLEFNQENKRILDIRHYDSSINFVLSKGFFEKTEIGMNFIIEQLKKNKLIIATIDRNRFTGKTGYKGHFILVKGFDKENVVCNDAYLGENLQIPRDKFWDAFYCIEGKKKTHHMIVIG
ncbi:MAG: C39 family peptidase [Candidatus Woesearchaeota archaeon]